MEDVPDHGADTGVVLARVVRRAPRFRIFVGTGFVLGLAVAVVLAITAVRTVRYSEGAVLGYLAVILGLLGALVGAGVAVLVDRSPRRSQGPR